MNTENRAIKAGISREAEEQYLAETISVIQKNIMEYGQNVDRMREEIDDMLEHFHDDNPELINTLENTLTMHDNLKRALERNEKALKKPYFGRIIFHDEALNKEESLYIGKGGISRDATNLTVVDWRAPVSNAYYENGLGKCSYLSPKGEPIHIDLKLKRTYEIEEGRLQNFFDTEVISNDDLLTKYLSKNKQAVLGEIVATIQQEQNNIIRKSPYHNMIVQGVAGSGKTTVAMHRISFILYNYAERFKPNDFYIVGSNRILLNYITGVLPDLDVYGVRQMTMEQLFVRLLYEDWDEKKYSIKSLNKSDEKESIKGSLLWFQDLEAYCNQLEWNTLRRESIYLNPKKFVEGVQDGKSGVFDRSNGENEAEKLVLLADQETVETFIKKNPGISLQSKIDILNDRLKTKIKDEFLGKGVKYTENEKKAILRAYHGTYGGTSWKRSIYALYEEFLLRQSAKGYDVAFPENEFDVYDLAALAYLYKRIKETEVISEAHHIVIDEAQDFGMMAYSVLKFCIKDCTYTIMGDVSQNIHFGYGLNDWEELKKMYLFDTDRASFRVLKKSYRNTVEISNFAINILHHGQFSVYPVEPIIRHGEQVRVEQIKSDGLIEKAAEVCRDWQKKGLSTIAVVCRDQVNAKRTAKELSKHIDVMESNLELAEFGNGIMVLPVEYTKGLEFDAVLIMNPTRAEYPVDDGHAKLLYVAATRALHELCVLHSGKLTGLITDEVPKRWAADILAEHAIEEDAVEEEAIATKAADKSSSGLSWNEAFMQLQKEETEKITSKPKPEASSKTVIAKTKPVSYSPYTNGSIGTSYGKVTVKPVTAVSQRLESKPVAVNTRGSAKPSVSVHSALATANRPRAVRGSFGNSFGDIPATELLRPAGHSKVDLGVMWAAKQKDGVNIQCRYGLLRVCPINSHVVRITFAKSSKIFEGTHQSLKAQSGFKGWSFKDSSRVIEVKTDELCVQIEKAMGRITYLDKNKQLLVTEKAVEGKMIEKNAQGKNCSWLYLDWQKNESIFAHRIAEKLSANLRKAARYISHGTNTDDLPLLFSDKGYGIVPATDKDVFVCDLPAYGSYLCVEKEELLDYYFMVGKDAGAVIEAYKQLRC